MSALPKHLSNIPDTKAGNLDDQAISQKMQIALRIREASEKKGLTQRGLSRASNLSSSRVNEYWNGTTVPNVIAMAQIADAVEVTTDWLIRGSERKAPLIDAASVDWAVLKVYDITQFAPDGLPEPATSIPLPRHWLASLSAPLDSLWVMKAPATVGDLVREGDQLICADYDGDGLIDGRVYVFLIDDSPIIRRAHRQPGQIVLSVRDNDPSPMVFPGSAIEAELFPVARLVGAMSVLPK